LPLILYGVVAGASIDSLFVAGVLPGLLLVVVLAVYSYWRNRSLYVAWGERSAGELRAAFRESIWELPLPIVVLGGIYSGYFAVSEAAAVTVLYVFTVEVIVLREIRWGQLPDIVRESMVLVGAIFMILGVSLASTTYMIDIGVPERLFALIDAWVSSKASFLFALIAFLLVLGAVLDIFSALVLVVPLIAPIATRYGVDPIHLGILFLATMELGYLTPPVGLNLFISGFRFDRSIVSIYRSTLPFFFVLLCAVFLIAYVPWLSLVLVR
jgi:tripartite ATP-independent transporter DctM subunit